MPGRTEIQIPTVMILADFSDGSWHATSFAMKFLYKVNSPVSILQTYKKQDWGHFMMRKLTTQLKEITEYELSKLKSRMLINFKIKKSDINTLSIEGDLNTILQYKYILKGSYNLVLGTYESFTHSCSMQNRCLERIINSSKKPLFILPGEFNDKTNKQLLFVAHPKKRPDKQLIAQIQNICTKTQSGLEILFVLKKGVLGISDKVLSTIHTDLEGIDITINQIVNNSRCKGINNYIKNEGRDLIIVDKN